MNLPDALRRPESKTLEFKRNLSSLAGLLRTVTVKWASYRVPMRGESELSDA